MTTNHTTLRILGSSDSDTDNVSGWSSVHYTVGGTARGIAQVTPEEGVADDDVLELELADGTHLLVAGADLQEYVGAVAARGDEGGTITIGPLLVPSSERFAVAPDRGIASTLQLIGITIFRKQGVELSARLAANALQDAQLKDGRGLFHCVLAPFALQPAGTLGNSDKPYLLFIHGTASSTRGSFSGLWEDPELRHKFVEAYGGNILAFEHNSLTESPLHNALELVEALPQGARLHVVSHSRGGMVGELLARTMREGADPFTAPELTRYRKFGKRRNVEATERDSALLQDLNKALAMRGLTVERFVRVACPARGTTLASGRLDRWASALLNLFGLGVKAVTTALPVLKPVDAIYGPLKNFLLAVVAERKDASVLPGLEAMMPDSALVDLLNAPGVRLSSPLHVISGDYLGTGLKGWVGDRVTELFYGGMTDLIVNTPSMTGGAERTAGIFEKQVRGREVTHFSYFRRRETAAPLLAALCGDDSAFTLLAGPSRVAISRGGHDPKPNKNAPLVYLLPGIMGSHIEIGGNRIWFDPFSMWAGDMDRLRVDVDGNSVKKPHAADGWLDNSYERLAKFLWQTHEVRPFAYDWRLSITAAAERFGEELDKGIAEAKRRGKPLRIVAHSMGGLVARLALQGRWDQLRGLPGSRLLQLGTPNNGSHAIAAVLLGRDKFVQTIEGWFDWENDMAQFLDIVSHFPGVLELMPWPTASGTAPDNVDYFDQAVWQAWYDLDQARLEQPQRSWVVPPAKPLKTAHKAIARLKAAPLDPELTLYVAGKARTPVAIRLEQGRVEIGWTDNGDGRVPWSTGIPESVPVWYAAAAHGDLSSHARAFEGYLDLLETGATNSKALSRLQPGARGTPKPLFQPAALHGTVLRGTPEEVLAAAIGGTPEYLEPKSTSHIKPVIQVIHGSLATSAAPVLTGMYENDSLRGSAAFLDKLMDGQLSACADQGRLPSRPDDAMYFMNTRPGAKPRGVILVGLGVIGELHPGQLTRALTNGFLEYVRCIKQTHPLLPAMTDELHVSTLLVGSGFSGLNVETVIACLLEAVKRCNRALERGKTGIGIRKLTIYEEVETRAIVAVQALNRLLALNNRDEEVLFDGRLDKGVGGYREQQHHSSVSPGTYRVHIGKDRCADGGLRFTLISDRARNNVAIEADQRQVVDRMLELVTGDTRDFAGPCYTLFELLVPNDMKEALSDIECLMMSLDAEAAVYPWELMRDRTKAESKPLATQIALVRQLATPNGRNRMPLVRNRRALVIGDTQSALPNLPGAQAEAQAVAALLARNAFDVRLMLKPEPLDLLEHVLTQPYMVMHFAGHGVIEADGKYTGLVLGPDMYLTPAQVTKMRRVPEFVFINCCHLGNMSRDTLPRWGQLAANLATQFIEIGCKAVIATGWAVDDAAAKVFAVAFYEAMFEGCPFAEAVRRAREAAYDQHQSKNTWGAYQAYGDDLYRLADERGLSAKDDWFVNADHLCAELEQICARLESALGSGEHESYRRRLEQIAKSAYRQDLKTAAVLMNLGSAREKLKDWRGAIADYRAALALDDACVSLCMIEKLASLEIRHGAELCMSDDAAAYEEGAALHEAGFRRLGQLLAFGTTAERLSLQASYWKRLVQVKVKRGEKADLIKHCLVNMQDSYAKASQLSKKIHGLYDYYPLFNELDAQFLVQMRQARTKSVDMALLQDQLDEGLQFARRRGGQDKFFHHLADIDAARIKALWAALANDGTANILDKAVLEQLADRYVDLFKRMGNATERDSLINQLQFLITMLPGTKVAKEVKDSLLRLKSIVGREL